MSFVAEPGGGDRRRPSWSWRRADPLVGSSVRTDKSRGSALERNRDEADSATLRHQATLSCSAMVQLRRIHWRPTPAYVTPWRRMGLHRNDFGHARQVSFHRALDDFPAIREKIACAKTTSRERGAVTSMHTLRSVQQGNVALVETLPAAWMQSPARASDWACGRPRRWRMRSSRATSRYMNASTARSPSVLAHGTPDVVARPPSKVRTRAIGSSSASRTLCALTRNACRTGLGV